MTEVARPSGVPVADVARQLLDGAVSSFLLDNRRYVVLSADEPFTRPHWRTCRVGEFTVDGHVFLIVAVPHEDGPGVERDPSELLTARELQIAHLVALGYPTKVIAHRLRISAWTVSTHLRRIFAKLHVDNRAAMVFRCASLIGRDDSHGMARMHWLRDKAGELNRD
jgi:DNA-binding CsgD family transcriptional regulator